MILGLKSMVCLWVLLLIFELYLDTVFHGEVESQMRRDLSVLKCLFCLFVCFLELKHEKLSLLFTNAMGTGPEAMPRWLKCLLYKHGIQIWIRSTYTKDGTICTCL